MTQQLQSSNSSSQQQPNNQSDTLLYNSIIQELKKASRKDRKIILYDLYKQELRQRAAHEFWAFCEYVMKDEETGDDIRLQPFHKKWCNDIVNEVRMVVFSPINTGKSFIHTVGNVLFRIGQNPNIRIAVISATAEMALKFMGAIQQYILLSPEYQEVFPDVKPMMHPVQKSKPLKWSEDKIVIERRPGIAGPTVLAVGIGVDFIGARFDYLICDDVLTMDNTESPTLLKRVIRWFDSTAKGRMAKPYSPIHVVGTAWRIDDLMHYLAEKKDWNVHKYSFEKEDEQRGHLHITWEERIPREMLDRERAHNAVEYNRQRRCVATSEEEQDFAPYMANVFMRDYDLKEVRDSWTKYMGVDLSGKKRPGTALIMIAVSPDGNMKLVLDVKVGAWMAVEKSQQIALFNDIHKPAIVNVEKNALQDETMDWMIAAGHNTIPFTGFQTNESNKFSGLSRLAIETRNAVWRFAAPEHCEDILKGGTVCKCDWCRFSLEVQQYPNYTSDDMLMSWLFANEAAKESGERELNFHIVGVHEITKKVALLKHVFGFRDYYVGNMVSAKNPNKWSMPRNVLDIVAHIKEGYSYKKFAKLGKVGVPKDPLFKLRDFAVVWLEMVYFCEKMNRTHKVEKL